MIKSKLLLSIIFLWFLSFSVKSQELNYKNYNWESNPKYHSDIKSDTSESIIIIKQKLINEFDYGGKENKDFYNFTIFHNISRINTDDAIDRNNKIYVSMRDVVELMEFKARVINKSGTIIEIDEDDIKDVEDEETSGRYKLVALEGVELECEIEYFYIKKKYGSYQGNILYFQSGITKLNVDFELITPQNLIFTTKSYNGFPELKEDTNTYKPFNCFKAHMDSIPKLEDEKYSAYDANLMYVDYKLDRNLCTGKRSIVSYEIAAQDSYNSIYQEIPSKSLKILKKEVKKLELDDLETEQKIRKLESYIKNNYAIVDRTDINELYFVEYILKNKYCSKRGMIRLFSAFLNEIVDDVEMVITTDRFYNKFDSEFESHSSLNKYLFFFPEIDMYLDPTGAYNRLGFVPSEYTATNGLFIKPVSLGDITTAIGKIKYIPPTSYDMTRNDLDLKVKFNNDLSKIDVHVKTSLTGYNAYGIQPYYSLISDEDKVELAENILKFTSEDVKIKNIVVENTDEESILTKPFIIEGDVSTSELIEIAGNKIMVKIGLIIGKQDELFHDDERKLEIENSYNRIYNRYIEFEIPKNYKVLNPEDLNIDIFYEKDGERTMTFTSTYKIEGNIIKNEVVEYYKNIIYPIELYENYRKVINAAADFNNIILILEKEK